MTSYFDDDYEYFEDEDPLDQYVTRRDVLEAERYAEMEAAQAESERHAAQAAAVWEPPVPSDPDYAEQVAADGQALVDIVMSQKIDEIRDDARQLGFDPDAPIGSREWARCEELYRRADQSFEADLHHAAGSMGVQLPADESAGPWGSARKRAHARMRAARHRHGNE